MAGSAGGSASVGGSNSTTTSSVASTNPALTALYTSLFTGGTGSTAATTLGGIMSGSTMASNTSQLYSTLQQSSQPAYQAGMAQVKEQAAKAGLTNSTSLTGQMGSYTNTYLSNLSQIATQMGLQETQMQGGVAGSLMEMLASSANQYYTNQSNTSALNWNMQAQASAFF
jgi:hypothetical protein